MIHFHRLPIVCFALAGCLMTLGCSRNTGPGYQPDWQERQDMISMVLPASIEIWPGTRIQSFDDDPIPDGILAIVRPLDQFGAPVKATGLFYFELWTFQKASADARGERIMVWREWLNTVEKLENHWTRGEMLEFPLAWPGDATDLKPDAKYLLVATHRSPQGVNLRTQFVLDFVLPEEAIISQAADE